MIDLNNTSPINQELYEFVDGWDGEALYRYIVIGLISIFVATKLGLTISFLIGLVMAYQIINYLNNREQVSGVKKDDLYKKKVDVIIPKLDKTIKYEKVVNIIFSIQDMYIYNPSSFYEINRFVENFFELYEKIERNHQLAFNEYDRLILYKRNLLNHMHTILFSLPNDQNIEYKLNKTIGDMDIEITKYIDHVSYLIDHMIYKDGYTAKTKPFIEMIPLNRYGDFDLPFTFEIY